MLGGKALWTKELEVALKEKDVDLLIHSLKDVPTTLPEGCVLGAILEREDPVDSLVVKSGKPWKHLDEFPEGSVVGTSSVRRIAQLKRKYPHLKFLDVVRPTALRSSEPLLKYITGYSQEGQPVGSSMILLLTLLTLA